MNKIIFDTETTGRPTNWNAADNDIDAWPRMVEIAWIVVDDNDEKLFAKRYIIKPDNFLIPIEVSNIHKITTEIANSEGVELEIVLDELKKDLENADLLIAHNIDFDYPILNCEFIRLNIQNNLSEISRFCTMKTYEVRSFCSLGKDGKKWPKLSELHIKLFGSNFVNAHSALVDAEATARCFLELKKRGIISDDIFFGEVNSKQQIFDEPAFTKYLPTVLIVEPHPTLRTVLVQRFREDGCRAATVGSFLEALDICREESPDLLVSAEILEESTALKLAQQIGSPVIVLTARSGVESITNLLNDGADDVLMKPFALEELIARARKILKRLDNRR